MRAGSSCGEAAAGQTKKQPKPLDAHAGFRADLARTLAASQRLEGHSPSYAATRLGAYAALLTRVYFERIGTICA